MPQADYSSAVGDHKTAPHELPSDADGNPAFAEGGSDQATFNQVDNP